MPINYSKKQKDKLIESVYNGETSIFNLPEDLFQEIQDEIFRGVTDGFDGGIGDFDEDSLEETILRGYGQNVNHFSAAKTFQQTNDMTLLLFEGGKKVSFAKFLEGASSVFDIYNKTWLEVEYNTATSQALNGRKWADIERTKETLPLLRYQTVKDARVRPEHITLDNIVKPVNDPFWNTHYPPNGWQCRCIVTQHERGELKETSLKGKKIEEIAPIFKMNSGKDRIIFDPKHPYFQVDKRYRRLKKRIII